MPHIRQGDRLLDVGCFDRMMIDRVLPRIDSALGLDLECTPTIDGRVEIRRGVFPDDFELPEASFDCITMLATLEHVESPLAMATECERLLRPGGHMILTVPHPCVDHILEVLIFLRLADGMAAEDHYGFDVTQTRSIFEQAGLRLVVQRRFQLGLNYLFVFEKPQPAGD